MVVSGHDSQHRPVSGEPAPGPRADQAGVPAPRSSNRLRVVVLAVAVVVLVIGLLAAALAVLRLDRSDGSATGAGADHTAVAPLDDRSEATFELVTGVTDADVRVADLGADLYRIGTPTDGGLLPRPEHRDGRVLLHLAASGRNGPNAVQVLLNERVTWQVVVTGGASGLTLDLAGARLAGVELTGGADRIDLRLPRPTGTLLVRMSGGVDRFTVRTPQDVPARVRVAAGAGSVRLHGEPTRTGVAAGEVLARSGWDGATDRLDLDLAAGAGTVVVTGE